MRGEARHGRFVAGCDMEQAREAFSGRDYRLAAEMYERCARERGGWTAELAQGYANSLARCGRLKEALDVWAHCGRPPPGPDRLRHLAAALAEAVTASPPPPPPPPQQLACPGCDGVLLVPVTAPCGHTYCRRCAPRGPCRVCGHKAGAAALETNILVQDLVEKWWPDQLAAARLRNEGNELFQKNLLEQALAKYDEAAQFAPEDHLLLSNRSHVLSRLDRPQEALVDADTAAKLRPRWGKAHFRRGVALSALGRHEEALVAFCACLAADRNPCAVRHELLQSLHRLLAAQAQSSPRCRSPAASPQPQAPAPAPAAAEDVTQAALRCMPLNCVSTTVQENSKLHNVIDRISQEVDRIRKLEPRGTDLPVDPRRVEPADLDCVLCCRTLWRPVTTPCGHTYCWMCLDRCLDYSYACPLCVTSLAEYLTCMQKSITEFVDGAMRRLLPAQYAARQLAHRQEVSQLLLSCGERQPQIPVFVCTSSFPGVPCPLFVYEPRYRVMVRQCVEAGTRQFGIAPCLSKEAGAKRYADFGTMLEIRDWVLLGDGCSILTTVGVSRFKVLGRGEKDGYDTAQVEFLKDQPVPPERYSAVRELHERVRQKGRSWFGTVLPAVQAEIVRTFGAMPAVEEDWAQLANGPAWAWWLLAILPLGQNLQVGILATVSLEKRLRAIEKTLDYIQRVSGGGGGGGGEGSGGGEARRATDHHNHRSPPHHHSPHHHHPPQAGGSRQEPRAGLFSRRSLQRLSTQMMMMHTEQSAGGRLVAEESS
ncbi:LON peptidase N-terminal domain and RING finger protein 3 [Bacillus rossius redtenbacheri]|uniref:LON peptidase N-terminal domain and RING finger protein 3 n=1 Tax=Bacillus rossius redtenbacheri TaxID=93214 RepID=UPI002FDE02DF